jgi:ribosomal protein S12 methylthiotransferase
MLRAMSSRSVPPPVPPPGSSPSASPADRTVAVVTLGCARNEVDSEELAGRLSAEGWDLVDDAESAAVVLVNTCGFVEAAKKDSIDTVLEAAELKESGQAKAVVAVGCLAERYGTTLAAELPEADAVLSFDDYPDIAERLAAVVAGAPHTAHVPRDRRALLPLSPVSRPGGAQAVPGHVAVPDLPPGVAPASGPYLPRRRLDGGPVAPLKLASGCDRRCAFCAIPSFRGAFLSRSPDDVLAEARWLAGAGVRELVLVSENSTSYGKDLGDLRLLESLLPRLAAIEGVVRVRVSYLQPAELRPGLLEVLAGTSGVVPYFDLSFQHSSSTVLRRMRRFGDTDRFLSLLDDVRTRAPEAGVRSNFIVGFPGETEADVDELERFLLAARLDAIGVFGYSDEDGTEAAGYDGKLHEDEIAERTARLAGLAEELTAQRAEERVGGVVDVLVEALEGPGRYHGRAEHQAPETDGSTTVTRRDPQEADEPAVGDVIRARVVGTAGVDLFAEAIEEVR